MSKQGIFLFDKFENVIGEIPPEKMQENSQRLVLNGLITGIASVKYEIAEEVSVKEAMFYGAKDPDNENHFWMYKIVNQRKADGIITLFGIHVMFDDLKGSVVRDKRPQDATPAQGFSSLLEGTRWSVGQSTATHTASTNFYYKSVLSALYDALDVFQCEFKPRMTFQNGRITGRFIDLYDELSGDFGKWFEHGDNLLDVIAEESVESLYTAFLGRGRGEEIEDEEGDPTGSFGRKIRFINVAWSTESGHPVDKPLGQDYVEIPWATEKYGYPDGSPRIAVVDFDDIEDQAELLQATYDYALDNCRPRLQLKSKALEQGMIEIGETVAIIRPDLDIRYKTRVYQVDRDFLSASLKDFELGDRIRTGEAARVNAERKAQKKKDQEIISLINQAIVNAETVYYNRDAYTYDLKADNEYGWPAGLYSFDRPIDQDPTTVTYYGSGLILMANEKNVDGSWKWNTAIENGQIVGSSVLAGSITANKLSADVGQSLDISSNAAIVNLVTNEILQSSLDSSTQDVMINMMTQLTQTSEGWEFLFGQLQTDLTGQIEGTGSRVSEIEMWVRIVDGKLILGQSDNELVLTVQNDRIMFEQGGQEVAYFSNSKLFVYDIEAINSLTIGNFRWVPRANGNLSLM